MMRKDQSVSTATALAALASAAVFAGLVSMSDRKRGAFVSQGVLVLAAVLVFVAIVAGPVAGIAPGDLGYVGFALIAAAVSGMLYHLYLGRFARVWPARGVFAALFAGLSVVLAMIFVALF